MPKISCPNCGSKGDSADETMFETRGIWQGSPVRKCLSCGAGMTVKPGIRGVKARIVDPALWVRMETSFEREFGSSGQPVTAAPPEISGDKDDQGDTDLETRQVYRVVRDALEEAGIPHSADGST